MLPNPDWIALAYDLYAEADTDDITPALAADIAAEVRAEFGIPAKRLPGARVQRWLTDEVTFSPHVDRIAVERALLFDWAAIDGLTDKERAQFIDRLCAMDDPLGLEHRERALHARRRGETGGASLWKESARHRRWMTGTEKQRNRVEAAARRRGVRLGQGVAA